MKQLIKKILREDTFENNLKIIKSLEKKFGEDSLLTLRKDNIVYRKLEKLGFNDDEIKGLKKQKLEMLKSEDYSEVYDKIDEYVNLYYKNPLEAKKRFLLDVISNIKSKSMVTKIYGDFLDKLSLKTGEDYSQRNTKPEKSKLLLNLSKFIEDPSETPKSRTEFLKTLGLPRTHHSTTFTKLLNNNLIKTVKKDGKWVYVLGDNFDKYIEGKVSRKPFVGSLKNFFDEFVTEHGHNPRIFQEKFKDLFIYDSDWSKFYRSFLSYVRKKRWH